MRTSQLLSGALGAALVLTGGCSRADADRETREAAVEVRTAAGEAAAEVRTAAAEAGDRLADGWLTTKIQAKYFADREVKARYISVSSRDRVVTLKGYVDSPEARREALQIARTTDGVLKVDDQLLIGVAPGKETFEGFPGTPGAVPTGGSANDYEAAIAASAATASLNDDNVTSMVQARFFLDPMIKVRSIDVQARNGVVTLRGAVASEAERAQALVIARNTNGVGRVEDLLTVGSSE